MRRDLIFLLLWQMSEETHTKTLRVLDLAMCYKIFSIMLKGEQLLPPLCPVIQPCCSASPAAKQNLELHLQFTLHASLILNL